MLNDTLDQPPLAQVFHLERPFTCLKHDETPSPNPIGSQRSFRSRSPSTPWNSSTVRGRLRMACLIAVRSPFGKTRPVLEQASLGRANTILDQRVMGWLNYLCFESPAQARRRFGAHPHRALARGLWTLRKACLAVFAPLFELQLLC